EPALPKLLSGRNSAWAVVAPRDSVKAQAAPATLATRAGPKRPRYQLLATRLPVSALPATKSGKRDRVIEISSVGWGPAVAVAEMQRQFGDTGMPIPPLSRWRELVKTTLRNKGSASRRVPRRPSSGSSVRRLAERDPRAAGRPRNCPPGKNILPTPV